MQITSYFLEVTLLIPITGKVLILNQFISFVRVNVVACSIDNQLR